MDSQIDFHINLFTIIILYYAHVCDTIISPLSWVLKQLCLLIACDTPSLILVCMLCMLRLLCYGCVYTCMCMLVIMTTAHHSRPCLPVQVCVYMETEHLSSSLEAFVWEWLLSIKCLMQPGLYNKLCIPNQQPVIICIPNTIIIIMHT